MKPLHEFLLAYFATLAVLLLSPVLRRMLDWLYRKPDVAPDIHRIDVFLVGYLNKIGDLGGMAIYDEIAALWCIDRGGFSWTSMRFDGVDAIGPRNVVHLAPIDQEKGVAKMVANIQGVRYVSLIQHEIKH